MKFADDDTLYADGAGPTLRQASESGWTFAPATPAEEERDRAAYFRLHGYISERTKPILQRPGRNVRKKTAGATP